MCVRHHHVPSGSRPALAQAATCGLNYGRSDRPYHTRLDSQSMRGLDSQSRHWYQGRPSYSLGRYRHRPGGAQGSMACHEGKPGYPRRTSEWATAPAVIYAKPIGQCGTVEVSSSHCQRGQRMEERACDLWIPRAAQVPAGTTSVGNVSYTGPRAGNDAVPYNQAIATWQWLGLERLRPQRQNLP